MSIINTKKRRAISPVLSVLLMIVVAVAGALVTYAWSMGYLDLTTARAGRAIQIQSAALNDDRDVLSIYVQNVGQGAMNFDDTGEDVVYVNGALMSCTGVEDPLPEGETMTLVVTLASALEVNENVKVKIVGLQGTAIQATVFPDTATGSGGGGGGGGTPPPTVTRITANTAGFGSATEGNLLVVIAGHRSGNPDLHHEPTIDDWELQEVAYHRSDTGDRRIVALFTKEATGGEDTVSVDWDDAASSSFTIYQEFTGATTYTMIASGANSDGTSVGSGDDWATSPLNIPSSALSDPGGVNILSIGAAVWRDGGPLPNPPYEGDMSSVSFTDLSDVIGPVAVSTGCTSASAFSYDSAVTQTSVSWVGVNMDDMVSGLLIQFECE